MAYCRGFTQDCRQNGCLVSPTECLEEEDRNLRTKKSGKQCLQSHWTQTRFTLTVTPTQSGSVSEYYRSHIWQLLSYSSGAVWGLNVLLITNMHYLELWKWIHCFLRPKKCKLEIKVIWWMHQYQKPVSLTCSLLILESSSSGAFDRIAQSSSASVKSNQSQFSRQ